MKIFISYLRINPPLASPGRGLKKAAHRTPHTPSISSEDAPVGRSQTP